MDRKAPFELQGCQLVAVASAVLFLMAVGLVLASPDLAGVRSVIRWTARTSLVLFLLTFTASAAWHRWPGAWTRWQLAIGVTWACRSPSLTACTSLQSLPSRT
jgi:hypothetical protein